MKPMPTTPFWYVIYVILGIISGLSFAHYKASMPIGIFIFATIFASVLAPLVVFQLFPKDQKRVWVVVSLSLATSAIIGKFFGI